MALTLLDLTKPWTRADAVIVCPDGTRVDLSGALGGARYYGSRGDGCYIELTVNDVEREILNDSSVLGTADLENAEYLMTTGGCDWIISECAKTDDGFTLTLYDAEQARGQRRKLPAAFKASTGSATSIQFVERLLEKAGLAVYAPDANQVRPIQGLTAADAKALQDARRSAAAFNALHSSNVYVLGDSLAVGSDDELKTTLGSDFTVHADADEGRTSTEGLAILTGIAPNFAQTLVVELGTNDDDATTFHTNVAAIMALAGDNRRVLWVNVARPDGAGDSDTDLNAVLTTEAGLHDNLQVIDWKGAVTRHEVTLTDGVHPDAAGYRLRARRIAAAIRGPI